MTTQIDAERLIIGSILLRPATYDVIADMLLMRMFENKVHQEIFAVMMDLNRSGKVVSRAAVLGNLGAEIDGRVTDAVLSALTHEVIKEEKNGAEIPIKQYAQQMIKNYQHVEGGKLLEEFKAELAKRGSSPDNVFDRLEDRIRALMSTGGSSPIFSEVNGGAAYFNAMAETKSRGFVPGVPLPLDEIGYVISEDSFEAGNLYGLLSSSGEGKTSLIVQGLFKAAQAGHPVCLYSYDQSEQQIIRQGVAQAHGISANRQRSADLSTREFEICKSFADWYDQIPFRVIHCSRETVGQLVRMCEQFQRRHHNGKTTLFAFDHIGKIQTGLKRDLDAGSRSGEINSQLKAFMRINDAAGVVLNQRNSAGMRRPNPRPSDIDLYGGEGAKADYDAIMYIYRKEKYKKQRIATAASESDWKMIHKVFGMDDADIEGLAELGVIKSRFGDPSRTSEIEFDATFTRYISKRDGAEQEGLGI